MAKNIFIRKHLESIMSKTYIKKEIWNMNIKYRKIILLKLHQRKYEYLFFFKLLFIIRLKDNW